VAGSVASGSVADGAVAGGSVAAYSVAAGVGSAPPHADSKSPNTVMNDNSVIFFISLLLLFRSELSGGIITNG